MIYIITPYQVDYLRTCKVMKVEPRGHDAIWVHNAEVLYGRLVKAEDKFIYGDQAEYFGKDTLKRIEIEIQIRSRR